MSHLDEVYATAPINKAPLTTQLMRIPASVPSDISTSLQNAFEVTKTQLPQALLEAELCYITLTKTTTSIS